MTITELSTPDTRNATATPTLSIADLHVSFVQYERGLRRRAVEAVRGMSLSVNDGELVALIGASGAGKSLLGHAVLDLLPPNARMSGTVLHRGEPVGRRGRGTDIMLLPQMSTALDPTSRVGAQARRAAHLAGIDESDVAARAALAARGLDTTADRRYPHELSGGMTRRVIGAIAQLGDYSVLIADEPTPGLHPEAVDETLNGLRTIADAGTGVLLITHELRNAVRVADRVVVCEAGRTVDEVPAAAFHGAGDDLEHPYTRALWQALPGNGFRAGRTRERVVEAC